MFELGQEIADILTNNKILFGKAVVCHSTVSFYIPFKDRLLHALFNLFNDYNIKINFNIDSNEFILKVKAND